MWFGPRPVDLAKLGQEEDIFSDMMGGSDDDEVENQEAEQHGTAWGRTWQ